MYIDNELVLADGQDITSSALSENVVRLAQDFGKGEPMALVVNVLEDFAGGGSLVVSMQHDDNAVFSSATTLVSSASYAAAALAAGAQIVLPIPPSSIPDQDYGAAYFTVTGDAFTAGSVQAQIMTLNLVNTAP